MSRSRLSLVLPQALALAMLFVVAFGTACSCGQDPVELGAAGLVLEPEMASLAPGAEVPLHVLLWLAPDDATSDEEQAAIVAAIAERGADLELAAPLPDGLTIGDGTRAFEAGGTSLTVPLAITGCDDLVPAGAVLLPGSALFCWRGSARRAPEASSGGVVSLTARARSMSDTSVLTLPPTLDAGTTIEADGAVSRDPDAAVEGCEGFLCVNGTLRTDDGCFCVCEPGWMGPACDERPAMVETLAGAGTAGFVEGIGSAARFTTPTGVAVGPDGTVYVADTGNRALRAIDPATGAVTTIAGMPSRGFADGPIASAGFDTPAHVAAASDGTLFVSEHTPPRIRVIRGGMVSTLPVELESYQPAGMAWSETGGEGTLYVAAGWAVLAIDVATGTMRSIAGSAFEREIVDGVGDLAGFEGAESVAVGADGLLRVTDWGGFQGGALRLVDPTTREVRTLVGAIARMGSRRWVGSGPIARAAGVVILTGDRIVVSEAGAHRLRRFTVPAGATSAFSEDFAGDPWGGTTDLDGEAGFVDGAASVARFDTPRALALSPDGRTVYVADRTNHAIRAVHF